MTELLIWVGLGICRVLILAGLSKAQVRSRVVLLVRSLRLFRATMTEDYDGPDLGVSGDGGQDRGRALGGEPASFFIGNLASFK